MKTLEATFRVITPMFLGGADQQADTTIRPASLKGALRFWWRALSWADCLEKSNHNEVEALKQLHALEARLFGIAAGEHDGGQGVFLLQVCGQKNINAVDQPFRPLESGQLYLLGQGLATFKNGNSCLRNAIKEGGEFTVKLLFRPQASAQDVAQISNALLLLGLLGALGSRARHGLGSVAMTAWTGSQPLPATVDDYKHLLASLLKDTTSAKALPPLTAFSQGSRIDLSATNKDVFKLLNSIGLEQQMYRSYGQKGMVSGKPSLRLFDADHDLILAATNGKQIDKAPKRAVFGLPHNYFFSSTKGKADVNYAPDGKEGRRASPLLLHLHPVGEQFVAVHTLLPARFLPDAARIQIKAKAKVARNSVYVSASPDWQVLHTYLNRFEPEIIHGGK